MCLPLDCWEKCGRSQILNIFKRLLSINGSDWQITFSCKILPFRNVSCSPRSQSIKQLTKIHLGCSIVQIITQLVTVDVGIRGLRLSPHSALAFLRLDLKQQHLHFLKEVCLRVCAVVCCRVCAVVCCRHWGGGEPPLLLSWEAWPAAGGQV